MLKKFFGICGISIFISCILLFIFVLYCSSSGQEQRFTSPSGNIKIIVKYDLASRPTIYKEDLPFNQKIWSYNGSGFTETVYFKEEWISENEFIFRYDDANDDYDEEYLITVE